MRRPAPLLDAHLSGDPRTVAAAARAAEAAGVHALWLPEIAHDPLLGAALAAAHTTRPLVGTAIALAFVRSPTALAYAAWDLALLSGGRFVLGLGSQVRAHVERRFGMPFDPPLLRMRDTVAAIRAVWQAWRTGGPLRHEGPCYRLSLMTPFFTPPPLPSPIPIYLAAVNRAMCRLAGQVADGIHVHPFHTRAYLEEVILPAVRRGCARAGRAPEAVTVAVSVIVAPTDGPDADRLLDEARRLVAFYASTPAYRPVLAHHGWERLGERLSRLAAAGRWDEMGTLVTDEVLETVAVVAPRAQLRERLLARAAGVAHRVAPHHPFAPGDPLWQAMLPSATGPGDR